MRRIAKSTGAKIVTTLADMEGNETFDPAVLGEAEEVSKTPILALEKKRVMRRGAANALRSMA